MATSRPTGGAGARATASRKNGAKGGRPRAKLPAALIERIGPPPDGPLALARWWQVVNAECAWSLALGEMSQVLAQNLRAHASTSARLIPADVMFEADRILRQEQLEREEDDDGPEEEVSDADRKAPALRRDPR